jgi:hypothetical protein
MSGSKAKKASRPATVALVLGILALAAIPVAAEIVAVPIAFVLGLIAVSLSRRARLRVERSVRRAGEGLVRAARLVAWSGVYIAVTGGLALAFYGVLRASS